MRHLVRLLLLQALSRELWKARIAPLTPSEGRAQGETTLLCVAFKLRDHSHSMANLGVEKEWKSAKVLQPGSSIVPGIRCPCETPFISPSSEYVMQYHIHRT